MVTNTGKVLYTATADQNNRVLLQVVANAGDIGGNLVTVGQAHTGDLTKGRVGLLGGGGSDSGAHTSLLGGSKVSGLILQGVQTLLQSGSGGLVSDLLSALSNELIKSRHDFLLSYILANGGIISSKQSFARIKNSGKNRGGGSADGNFAGMAKLLHGADPAALNLRRLA